MITYCCTDKCDKRMSCKRYAVYTSLSSTAKLQKSIIDLSRICPQNKYSLFIPLPIEQKIKIYCIMGRSASGKTTISNELSKRTNIKTVKSYTTRPMRTGENPETSDHIFISENDISKYENDYAAYTEINGYKYFITMSMLRKEKAWIYVIDPYGYEILKNTLNSDEFEIYPIYILRDSEKARQGAIDRGDDISKWEERRKSEDKQFTDFENKNNDHVLFVNNNDNKEAVIKTLIEHIRDYK